jgi:hypothetical protein
MLRELGACAEQVEIVEREWPNGVPITVPTIRKAYRLGLDVEWFTRRVLSPDTWAEWEKVTDRAWAEYDKVTTQTLVPLLRAALTVERSDG